MAKKQSSAATPAPPARKPRRRTPLPAGEFVALLQPQSSGVATARYGDSTLRQDFILYRDQPWVEVRVVLDWHEQLKLLKLAFPAALTEPTATFEIPYGVLERPVRRVGPGPVPRGGQPPRHRRRGRA